MSIRVEINSIDRTNHVIWSSLRVEQNLTHAVDNCGFSVRKYDGKDYAPTIGEVVEVFDQDVKIFGGTILTITESIETGIEGIRYEVACVDYTHQLDGQIVSKTYTSITISEIISDLIGSYTDGGFNTDHATSEFVIEKIVFNQIPISTCLKRLANLVKYEWYVDQDKFIYFFPRFSQSAPFNLTDVSGNYVYKSLQRKIDGGQIVNKVVVRGGLYDADAQTDIQTVKGNETKSFKLPYQFSNLVIEVDVGAGFVPYTVLIDFINDFSGAGNEVLYNFQEKTIRFENPLSDGARIRFTGNPKTRVLQAASDSQSIEQYGLRAKVIRDSSIEDVMLARRRANAEIKTYKDQLEDAAFSTYNSGLRAGMVISLNSAIRNCETNFIIKRLTMQPKDKSSFVYKVNVVTTRKHELTELLQEMLMPDPNPSDEADTAEDIKTDQQNIQFVENIQNVPPKAISEELHLTENIQINGIGEGVEPIWVLGPHIPNPWPADPKREGRLNISFKVY